MDRYAASGTRRLFDNSHPISLYDSLIIICYTAS